jgi:hypothetical protein
VKIADLKGTGGSGSRESLDSTHNRERAKKVAVAFILPINGVGFPAPDNIKAACGGKEEGGGAITAD